MRISVVLIAKNEEALLSRCLESVKEADEIVLVDTGSTDKTIEIAKKYTDKVYNDFTWCDSYCKARNHAKSKATGDWILSIDADEFLHNFQNVREAVEIAEKQGSLAVDVYMHSEDGLNDFRFPRLFKNTDAVWWEGDIHNHLSIIGVDVGHVDITFGYSPAHLLDPDRSYRILKKSVEEHGGPREMFYLGREYVYRGMYAEAVQILGRYVQLSRYIAEKADAFLTMSKAYWSMGMADDARDACVQALICNANFKEAILFMAKLAGDGSGNEKWQKNADQWKKMAETADNSDVLFVRNV